MAAADLGVSGAGCGVAGSARASVARASACTRAHREARNAHRVQLCDENGIYGPYKPFKILSLTLFQCTFQLFLFRINNRTAIFLVSLGFSTVLSF